MRFLKTLTLNRRALYDGRVALDTDSNFTLTESITMILPHSDVTITSPVTGQLRYNVTTDEVEVYQGTSATWRNLRYKESIGIIQQDLGAGDYAELYFGPLNPSPADTTIDSNLAWATHGNATTDGASWTGANILVIVENVIQIYNTNFTIVQNPAGNSSPTGPNGGDPYPAGYYVKFDTPVPLGKYVTVLHGFDR